MNAPRREKRKLQLKADAAVVVMRAGEPAVILEDAHVQLRVYESQPGTAEDVASLALAGCESIVAVVPHDGSPPPSAAELREVFCTLFGGEL